MAKFRHRLAEIPAMIGGRFFWPIKALFPVTLLRRRDGIDRHTQGKWKIVI